MGDDGFQSIGCCVGAALNLPSFPAVTISGSYSCIQDCLTVASFNVKITIGATTAYDSGGAFIRLYNDPSNLYLVMNDHANVIQLATPTGPEVARVGLNARSSLVFQISF